MEFGDDMELQQYRNASHSAFLPPREDMFNPGITAFQCIAWGVSLRKLVVIQPFPDFIIISAETADQMVC